MEIYDEYANYHYKDLTEMLNSPEYKRFTELIRKGVDMGILSVYTPLQSKENIMKCPYCDYEYDDTNELIGHLLIDHELPPFYSEEVAKDEGLPKVQGTDVAGDIG